MTGSAAAVRWADVATKLRGRIGKQCRERWFYHLDPGIQRGPFTPAEDARLFELRRQHGAWAPGWLCGLRLLCGLLWASPCLR